VDADAYYTAQFLSAVYCAIFIAAIVLTAVVVIRYVRRHTVIVRLEAPAPASVEPKSKRV
jgi:hypothetical protein